ncbi:MAG: mercury methylation corrinoid protein HgcA, partial [Planctomycetota bacterium]
MIRPTTSRIDPADRWAHFLARCGINRGGHRVDPGLYSLGNPTKDSQVFVSANYKLSFNVLRSSLTGIDCYILVLDTRGVNVWCAAGKGTFGTEELVSRVQSTKLNEVVRHRKLVLPQLGA